MNAKMNDVEEGDILIADGGFPCMTKGEELLVFVDEKSHGTGKYIECRDGRHYLIGQVDDQGLLVGLTKKEKPQELKFNDKAIKWGNHTVMKKDFPFGGSIKFDSEFNIIEIGYGLQKGENK